MNTKIVAERLWIELNQKNLGTETGISFLEKELKKCIEQERNEIVFDITEKAWSFPTIPFTMWAYSIITLAFKPKKFFYLYFKSIQGKLAQKIKNRIYN